jgi:hypothetical protein
MSYYALTLGGGGGGSGTVTSVSWTGGIVSIATATTTPAFTIAGTSGGIVYFDSATTWASSGVLTNNALIKGGGAGGAPSSVTTGTGVLTALGVNTGSAGAFVVNGGDLGTPSAGVVTNLTGTASININGTVGATTANTGTFSSTVHKGATSGTVTITAPAIAGTQSYTLPSAVPAGNGYALTSTTGGVMSWAAATGPGGSTTQVQYNNAGAFGGISGFTTDGTRVTASSTIGVGAATPSTSGAGITFPATQSASTDANTLDDYEEGTWTPTLTAGTSGTISVTTTIPRYVKIGRLVTCTGLISITSVSSPSGDLRINGLPFATASDNRNVGAVQYNGFLTTSAFTSAIVLLEPSLSYALFRGENNGSQNFTMANNAQASAELILGFSYLTTA